MLANYILILVLVAACGVSLIESIAVMSIDLGSEFMKIGIVKPGVPMEIVLNKESRRKTPLAVSLRGAEREFGENALSQAIKSPKSAYLFVTQLLGKSIDNPVVKAYREKYPFYDIREDEATKTIYFQHDDSTKYTPEELVAMILDYAKDLAADFGEQVIDAAVITVPPYFNQAERKAVLRAAEIVNLKVLQLINSNVAAALNYGVFRRKDFNATGTTIMFFDLGSTGTTATIGTFQMVKNKDDVEANPQLTIRGVGFDRNLGGNAFSMRLAKHLAKLFEQKTKKNVFANPKATLKIYKEADRVKNILSANTDTFSQVEGLMDDVDFKAKVTREEFETMCADLFERVKTPVADAFKMAEISSDEITSVILVGGGTRIPKIQDELMKATKKSELGKNLNTDEAPALGAVYQAAFQSKGYKVKKFYIREANIYPIVVDFEKYQGDGTAAAGSAASTVRRVLFDKLNPYPQKKVMTFGRHTTDFGFNVNYGDLDFLDQMSLNTMGVLNLSHVQLKGVEAVFEKHKNEESKGIKVHFKMDESGIVELDKIDISFEKEVKEEESTLSKIGNTISSFFGGGGEDANEKELTQEETTIPPTTTTTTTTPTEDATTTPITTTAPTNVTANSNQTASNVTLVKESIQFEQVWLDLVVWPSERYNDVRSKLSDIKEREREKRKRAAAINSLETYIFDLRDKLDASSEFAQCSTQDERERVRGKVDEIDAWLSETDASVELKAFQDKLTELKNSARDITFRMNEKKNRPKKLDELKDVLNKSMEFLENMKNMTGEDKPLTEIEWTTLDKLIASIKEWRAKMLNEQAKLSDNQDPKLLSNDIQDKIDELKREVNYMISKIKYFKPKTTKKPVTKTDNGSSSSSSDNDKEQSSERKDSEQQQEQQDQQQRPSENGEDNSKFGEDFFDKQDDQTTTTTDKPNDDTTTDNPEL